MKPQIEMIEPNFGSSFKIKKSTQQYLHKNPVWHAHAEYEVVYISDGSGKRHIGNHISYYDKGDLILLGPNLPHFGFTQDQHSNHYEIIVQFREDFLGEQFLARKEMAQVRRLMERARTGLSFRGRTKATVGRKLLKIYKSQPFERLVGFLEILQEMAVSEDAESLNANGKTLNVMVEDQTRMRSIYAYVESNYHRNISLEEISSVANMTEPAFCRYFKKHTGQTFTQFVNEMRIMHATRLLAETDMLITDVAHESGFNNVSHFNRHFLKVTGQRPSDYRRESEQVVTIANMPELMVN